jgi:hypothetical protein
LEIAERRYLIFEFSANSFLRAGYRARLVKTSASQFDPRYLIANSYHLTALEFECENYERTGTAIAELTHLFSNFSHFPMFEEMWSVSELSLSASGGALAASHEALRIHEDRIAVVEDELRVTRDALEEAQSQILSPPPPTLSGPADLQKRDLRPSLVAFRNEFSASKTNEIPDNLDLVHLLRAFRS